MQCWACSDTIRLVDLVNALPIVDTPVHRACYVRLTGNEPPLSQTLLTWLTRLREAA
jgi:hypothetical protein